MNLLRECIRELLTEAAKGPQDLPAGCFIKIEPDPYGAAITYVEADGYPVGRGRTAGAEHWPWGEVIIEKIAPEDGLGFCAGAWMIGSTHATSGWGPMLYDVAMEYATMKGGGLVSDRGAVSPSARKVWDYYLNSRGDVTVHQLDDLQNTLTPEEEDNCQQKIATYNTTGDLPKNVDWVKSPLSKRYTKDPETIIALKLAGKLKGIGVFSTSKTISEIAQSNRSIELYHGTRTMPDMRNIESFRSGASAGKSQIPGRQGFYVYTDKETVLKRLQSRVAIKDDYAEMYRAIDPEEDGYPMVVTVEVSDLNPDKWDMDMEAQQGDVVQGLINTIDLWLPKMRDVPVPVQNVFRRSAGGTLRFGDAAAGEDHIVFPFDWVHSETGRKGTTRIRLDVEGYYSIDDGERLAVLFKVISTLAPQAMYEMEKEAFSAALEKPTAIKYVSEETLSVKKIEVLIDNSWIDVTTSNPPLIQDEGIVREYIRSILSEVGAWVPRSVHVLPGRRALGSPTTWPGKHQKPPADKMPVPSRITVALDQLSGATVYRYAHPEDRSLDMETFWNGTQFEDYNSNKTWSDEEELRQHLAGNRYTYSGIGNL